MITENQDNEVVAKRRSVIYGVQNSFEPSLMAETEDASSELASLPTDAGTCHQISVEAIASYSELLGNGDDYEKTVREIMYIREHGEPQPDTETMRNAWTSAYEELESKVRSNGISTMSVNESSGIEETRSMLGLPSNYSVSVMAANSVDEDPTSIDTYVLDDTTKSMIESLKDEIDSAKQSFLSSLVLRDARG